MISRNNNNNISDNDDNKKNKNDNDDDNNNNNNNNNNINNDNNIYESTCPSVSGDLYESRALIVAGLVKRSLPGDRLDHTEEDLDPNVEYGVRLEAVTLAGTATTPLTEMVRKTPLQASK